MKILGIQGSPTTPSRTASLLALAQSHLAAVATDAQTIHVRELPADAVLRAQFDHPETRHASAQVEQAQVVLIATPIYKAAYSGVLKAFLDLLPQDGLRGKTVLPLATGGSIAHLLALDYALKPMLAALGARDILDPVFAVDTQFTRTDEGGFAPAPEVAARLDTALQVVIDRAEDYERRQAAAREREALLARVQPRPSAEPWTLQSVRWSR